MNVTSTLAPAPTNTAPSNVARLPGSDATAGNAPAGLGALSPKSDSSKAVVAQLKIPYGELKSTCKSDDPSRPPPCVDMTPAQGQKLLQIAQMVYKKGNHIPATPIEFTFRGVRYLATPHALRGPMTYDINLKIQEKNNAGHELVFESGQQVYSSADFPSVTISGINQRDVDPLLDAAAAAIAAADKKGLLKE
jgi:hypothetical protein